MQAIERKYTREFLAGDTVGLRLLKNKGFKEESMTKVRLYALGTSTTLESNKSLRFYDVLDQVLEAV
jgi:hypothetical protein